MGSTKIEAPAQPSVQSSISDWVQNYPAVFALQQQYAPQEAQQQLDLLQQYAGPLGQAYKTAQDQMYPQETAITNQLSQQVQEGMSGQLPDWAQQSYMDTMRAQLGENALAGVGADYMSRGLMEQQKNWQDYYRNLGLSISGRQPVYTANMPQYTQQASTFTPGSVMGFNQQGYGTAMQGYGIAQNAASQGNPYINAGMGVVGMGLGSWMGNPNSFWGS